MALLVALSELPQEKWAARLEVEAPGLEVRRWPHAGRREDIEFALVWKPPAGLLSSLPALKAIFSLGAGVDHILEDPHLPDVPIVRFVDPDLTQRMVEYVALHVLFHHRQMFAYIEQQARGEWNDLRQAAAGRVGVGVMGLGELGGAAARQLAALGFKVAGWSASRHTMDGIECFAGPEGLDAFLARSEILVCLLPLTAQTRGMLDHRLFEKLSPDGPLGGPVLINAGRGGLHVEADIVAALEAGLLKGASLDVFEDEPLPRSSPLWRHPRVLETPHCASVTAPYAVCTSVAEQIARFEAGAPLANVIDRERGY